MAIFPLSRRKTGAVAGGLGAAAGLLTANLLKAAYPEVAHSPVLFALVMFLASYFFITVLLALLNRLNVRAGGG